jgi:hypothetical protein
MTREELAALMGYGPQPPTTPSVSDAMARRRAELAAMMGYGPTLPSPAAPPQIRAGQNLAGVGLPALGKPPEVDRPWLNRIGSAALEAIPATLEMQGTLANLATQGLRRIGAPEAVAMLPAFMHATSPVAAAGRAMPQSVRDLREGIGDRYQEQRNQFIAANPDEAPWLTAAFDTTAETASMAVDPTVALGVAGKLGGIVTKATGRAAPRAAATLAKPLTQLGAQAGSEIGPLGRYFTWWGKDWSAAGARDLAEEFSKAGFRQAGKAAMVQQQVDETLEAFTRQLDTLAGGDTAKAAQLAEDSWKWMTAKDKASVTVAPELLPHLQEARKAQDALSTAAINEPGFLGKKGSVTARAQLGRYQYRFYRATTDPDWLAKVEGTPAWGKATGYYQKVLGYSPDEAATAARGLIENAYNDGPKALFDSPARIGQSNLKRRQNVPPPLRELLGEEKDFRVVFPESMRRLADGLSTHQMLEEIRQIGWGRVFFPPENLGMKPKPGQPQQLSLFNPSPAPAPTQAATPQLPPQGFEHVIDENNFALGPLRGVSTSRPLAQVIEGIRQAPEVQGWTRQAIGIMNRWTKGLMTAGNPASNVRNHYTWAVSGLMTGHGPSAFGKATRVVVNGRAAGRRLLVSEEAKLVGMAPDVLQAKKARAAQLGIFGEGASSGDVRAHLKLGERVAPQRIPGQGKLANARQTAAEGVKSAARYAQDLYVGVDDANKFYLWLSEYDSLRKALPKMTDDAVEELAATNIRNITPTWSMSNKFTEVVRKSLVVGMFPTYVQQVGRNAVEIAKLGFNEMSSGNAALARLGARRVAGLTAAILGPTSVVAGARYAAGQRGPEVITGTAEERAIRAADALWERGSDMVVLPGQEPGQGTTVNLSYADPLGSYKQAFLGALSRMDEGALAAAVEGIVQMAEPYLGIEALPTTASEMLQNERTEGGSITVMDVDLADPIPDVARISSDYGAHAIRRLGGPIKTAQRLIGAAIPGGGTAPPERKYPLGETLANAAGLPRTTTRDFGQTLSRRIWDYTSPTKGKIGNIRKLVKDGRLTEAQAQDRFERNVWPQLQEITDNLRAMRIQDRQLAEILDAHGLTKVMNYRLRKKERPPRLQWGGREKK